jgi:hypothetical protein
VEAAELFDELRAAAIPLGDRSRLRKASEGLEKEKARRHYHQTQVVPCAEDAAASLGEHDRRQLQSGGGFSIEVAAIVVTGLIGMIGYIVQARSAQKASQAQARLGRKAAEREKAEDRAGKQLERVQTQNTELVYPVGTMVQLFWSAFYRAALECGLEDYLTTYAVVFVSPPTQPHATVWNGGNPKSYKAVAASPFLGTLSPDDVARLAADPTKRARWVELATHTLLPVLRELVPIIQNKVCQATRAHSPERGPSLTSLSSELGAAWQMHLAELPKPDVLNSMLPGLGCDWTEIIASMGHVYYRAASYATEWEAVAARWAADDHTLLQPAEPCWLLLVVYVGNMLKQTAAKKELELCGSPYLVCTKGGRTA